MAIDDFLNSRPGGSRGAYLKNWKKDGKVTTWMHVEHLPMVVWKHTPFPRLVVIEDKQTGDQVTHVWSGDYVCHEREDVLAEQYALDAKGNREHPPEYCPMCRLVDYVRRLVTAGRLDWHKPLFKFVGDDDKETVVLHAGGIFFTRKMIEDLDEEEIRAARKSGVVMKELWKETAYAKPEYLFVVVDDAHPETGLQKSFQKPSLGDAVKDVIVKARESDGVEEGDPTVNPYAIQWQFRKDEEPKRMYTAIQMRKVKFTPAIEKLITGPAPDIKKDVQPFNVKEVRAFLEQHCLVKLPWDDIFDVNVREDADDAEPPSDRRPAAPTAKRTTAKARRAEPEELEEPKPAKGAKRAKEEPEKKGPKKRGEAAREPVPDDDDAHAVACEKCGKAMWDDAHECPHCEAKYDAKFRLVEEEPEEERKPAPRRRAAAPDPEPSRPAGREPGDDEEENIDPIPF